MSRLAPATLGLLLLVVACSSSASSGADPAIPRPTGYPQPGDLVVLLRQDNPYLRQTTALIAKTGNEREKDAATAQLVALANHLGADEWRASQRHLAERMSRLAQSSSSQRAAWVDELQRRHLVRVYDSLQTLGTERALDHCRGVYKNEGRRPVERRLALGVLAAHGKAKRGPEDPWSVPGGRSPAAGPGQGGVGPTTWPGPRAGRRPDAPRVKGGTIVDVDRVVDALRPYFKACYVQALRQYGRFGSWVILSASVTADGRVQAVSGSGDDSAPYSMMACLRHVVAQARFAPPTGGSATVEIPLAFTADVSPGGR
ncbi:MAG: hypothetical protein JRI23_07135 [Deltaproteobacteria bacterium]|jgi:hypothetical protein|nr:hypothetical protein [Deltaproteobacteria bacterium]MBW2531366.1 hypothetical protein [Deltaproteobacteria bacterium]